MPDWFKNWENTGLIVYDDKIMMGLLVIIIQLIMS